MATFPAYKVMDGQNHSLDGIIWWDGERVRCSDEEMLRDLKQMQIGNLSFEDGKAFFDVVPKRYSNGYTYMMPAQVNKDGKEV